MRASIFLAVFFMLQAANWAVCDENTIQGPPSSFDGSSLSSEEKQWLGTFYKGTFFAQGWDEITTIVLANTPENQQREQQAMLAALGLRIGIEWAKDNEQRKIDTSKLKAWGDSLKKAAKKAPSTLPQVMASINSEVDSLLN